MTIAASQFEIDTDFHIAGYRAESLMTVGTTKMPTFKRRLYMGSLPTVRMTYTGGLFFHHPGAQPEFRAHDVAARQQVGHYVGDVSLHCHCSRERHAVLPDAIR